MSSPSITECALVAIKAEEAITFSLVKSMQVATAFLLLAMVLVSSFLIYNAILSRKSDIAHPHVRTPLEILQDDMAKMKCLLASLELRVEEQEKELVALRDLHRDEIKDTKGLLGAIIGSVARQRGVGIPNSCQDENSKHLKGYIKAQFGDNTNVESIYMG